MGRKDLQDAGHMLRQRSPVLVLWDMFVEQGLGEKRKHDQELSYPGFWCEDSDAANCVRRVLLHDYARTVLSWSLFDNLWIKPLTVSQPGYECNMK